MSDKQPILSREALERAARIAGANAYTNRFVGKDEPAFAFTMERLEAFAEALVLATIGKTLKEREAAVLAEREACAQIAEQYEEASGGAAAIRARGTT